MVGDDTANLEVEQTQGTRVGGIAEGDWKGLLMRRIWASEIVTCVFGKILAFAEDADSGNV